MAQHGYFEKTDKELVDHIVESGFIGDQSAPVAEMLRRVIESVRQLTAATQAAGDCAATQNAQMIKLTTAIRVLTWVLIAVGVMQIALMVWSVLQKGGA